MLTRDERLGCNLPAHSRGTTRIATLPTADAEGCSHSLRYVGRGPADLVIAMRCSIRSSEGRFTRTCLLPRTKRQLSESTRCGY